MGSISNNKNDGANIAVTDNGNYIVDLFFTAPIADVALAAKELKATVGRTISVCLSACLSACLSVRSFVCLYVCLPVCLFVNVCACLHIVIISRFSIFPVHESHATSEHTHTCIYTYMCLCICVCVCVCACVGGKATHSTAYSSRAFDSLFCPSVVLVYIILIFFIALRLSVLFLPSPPCHYFILSYLILSSTFFLTHLLPLHFRRC